MWFYCSGSPARNKLMRGGFRCSGEFRRLGFPRAVTFIRFIGRSRCRRPDNCHIGNNRDGAVIPCGLVATQPLQSIGNGATFATILSPFNWDAMIFGSDFVPSPSTRIEADGVFGVIEGASTTTFNVGVRGKGWRLPTM